MRLQKPWTTSLFANYASGWRDLSYLLVLVLQTGFCKEHRRYPNRSHLPRQPLALETYCSSTDPPLLRRRSWTRKFVASVVCRRPRWMWSLFDDPGLLPTHWWTPWLALKRRSRLPHCWQLPERWSLTQRRKSRLNYSRVRPYWTCALKLIFRDEQQTNT